MVKKIFLCLLLCFVFVLSAYSQDGDKTVLLKLVFEKIEKKHNVTIDYLDEEIAIFKIIPPNEELALEEKLDYISKRTQLTFRFISDNYITAINNKNLDKPICGFIIDENTKLPIASATISIKSINYSVVSNEKGYFELAVRSPNDIEISHVNYEKKVVSPTYLYQTNCPTLSLKSIEYELKEVITQVYLTKGITRKIDGSFEINPKKFGLLPGSTEPDVFQTMLQLPGIMSIDETISNINVRGGTHDQNLFLWNGIRLFQTGHFYGLISALNPNLSQKISIVKNGTSAFYDESVSSTVNINTNSDVTKSSNSIGANMINADINLAFKLAKKSTLEVSARRSITDFWTSPTYKSYLNRVFQNTVVTNVVENQNIKYESSENFYFYDASVKFHQKIKEKTNLIFNFLTISNLLDVNQKKNENNLQIERQSSLNQQTIAGSVEFNTIWNSKTSSQIIAYSSFYKVNSENQAIEGNQIFNQENSILDNNIQLKNTHIINDKFVFKNGYQFDEIGIRNFDRVNSPLFSRNVKDILHNHSLIAEMDYHSKNKKLNATVGFRENYISQLSKFISEPRFQLNYELSDDFQIQALAETKSQTCWQIVDLQQDFLGIEKRRWVLLNSNDTPLIKSKQASIGFSYKKRKWLITMDNFYKKVTGISSRSENFQNQLEFLKINGEYTILGAEILIQKQIGNLVTWLTYTFTNNEYTFNDFSPSHFPNNFENKHQINAGIIYDYKKLKIALGTHWFTGKPITLPQSNTAVDNQIVYSTPNSSRLDDYFQVNFSSGYTMNLNKKSKLQLGFSIQNLFNTSNIINQYFRINSNTSSIEKVNTYGLEFTPNAFLRFHF
jgi:hypothetical protein